MSKCIKHNENFIFSFNTFSKKYYECSHFDDSDICISVINKPIDERYNLLNSILCLLMTYFYSPFAILALIFFVIDYSDFNRTTIFSKEKIDTNIVFYTILKNKNKI